MKKDLKNDELLREMFDVSDVEVDAPGLPPHLIKIVESRKENARPDIFTLFAAFLNVRLKLYQVVIFLGIVGGMLAFFAGRKTSNGDDARSHTFETALTAVNNSTVLSSINTFVLKK